jgi:hypothetical protein
MIMTFLKGMRMNKPEKLTRKRKAISRPMLGSITFFSSLMSPPAAFLLIARMYVPNPPKHECDMVYDPYNWITT